MIGRDKAKMAAKLEEIQKDTLKEIQVMQVPMDFSMVTSYNSYEKFIYEKVKDLDIGILIANAGYAQLGPFRDLTPEEVQHTVRVNAIHPIMLIKVLVDKMAKRSEEKKVKGAIVVVSSGIAARPISGNISYSAAKVFSTYLAQGLNFELEGLIDVMSYEPGEVDTKMLGVEPSWRCISPEQAAQGCFRDLGHLSITHGCQMHECVMCWIKVLPLRVVQAFFLRLGTEMLQKKRAEQSKAAE